MLIDGLVDGLRPDLVLSHHEVTVCERYYLASRVLLSPVGSLLSTAQVVAQSLRHLLNQEVQLVYNETAMVIKVCDCEGVHDHICEPGVVLGD